MLPNFWNLQDQQEETSFEGEVPNTRLLVVIGVPLLNSAVVQAASKQTLSNSSLLSNVWAQWGEKMRLGLYSEGVPMSPRSSCL